jgi:hypothetical protein
MLTPWTEVMQGSPLPKLTRAYIMRKAHIKRALKIKEDYFSQELKIAVERLEDGQVEQSAVNHVMMREKSLAEKEGRKPNYFSRVIMDEVSPIFYLRTLHNVNEHYN